MKKAITGLFMLLALLACSMCAHAQEAMDITQEVAFHIGKGRIDPKEMVDRRYTTYYALRKGGSFRVVSDSQAISGVKVQFYEHAARCTVEALVEDAWTEIGQVGAYLSDWVNVPAGVTQLRLTNLSDGRAFFAEITVYGEGDAPADAPVWHVADKADMMLVVAHPDDELLWFGGLLPTYAGERGLSVQVVYVVPTMPNRRLELLDGLQHCGVQVYPAFVGMADARANTLEGQYKLWNRQRLYNTMTALMRQYRPDVVVTQDFRGEYGHGAHRATADATVKAVEFAMDSSKHPDSAKQYGLWQVSKVYVHLYGENRVQLDWHVPLERFGGKDGMAVAAEALACHVSQVKHGWAMEEGGQNDNSLFGLYFTAVGPDENGNDLMEHIAR